MLGRRCYRRTSSHYDLSLHLGLPLGKKPQGDWGKKNPGEGGAGRPCPVPAPNVSGWGNGEKTSGGGYWNPGEINGYGDLGDKRFRYPLREGRDVGRGERNEFGLIIPLGDRSARDRGEGKGGGG